MLFDRKVFCYSDDKWVVFGCIYYCEIDIGVIVCCFYDGLVRFE